MKYLIQTCHANEMLLNRWRTVEEIDDNFQDHIASPSFEISRGLFVRIIHPVLRNVEYIGVYGDNECIDLGPESVFYLKAGLQDYENVAEFWRTSNNLILMFSFLELMIGDRQRMRTILKFLPNILYMFQNDYKRYEIAQRCIEAIRQWTTGAKNEEKISRIVNQLSEVSPLYAQRLATRAIHAAAESTRLNTPGYDGQCANLVADAMSEYEDVIKDRKNAEIAKIIREQIPFYDIVFGITDRINDP